MKFNKLILISTLVVPAIGFAQQKNMSLDDGDLTKIWKYLIGQNGGTGDDAPPNTFYTSFVTELQTKGGLTGGGGATRSRLRDIFGRACG